MLMICFYNVYGNTASSLQKMCIFSQSKNQDLHSRETRNRDSQWSGVYSVLMGK